MKLSLLWVFDHIDADWRSIDINDVIKKFNQTTAEIEGFHTLSFNHADFSLARITALGQIVVVESAEWGVFNLSSRVDAKMDSYYLITKINGNASWAKMSDLGSSKEGLIPELMCEQRDLAGGWKNHFEWQDYIIELDNKSVTNRPDMWGHRGFAREIAAIYNFPLKPLSNFIVPKIVRDGGWRVSSSDESPISIAIDDQEGCSRFSALYLPSIQSKPSNLFVMNRLVKTDNRALDGVVDATNYTMFDMGHAMHAFDADCISGSALVIRKAKNKESLNVLDGSSLTLTHDDIVVADSKGATALGGIMGGADSKITTKTKRALLEAACFDATTIRRTATRHKMRTEASARFEKTPDGMQNIIALERFLAVAQMSGIPFKSADTIISLGKVSQPITIVILHALLEDRIGVSLDPQFVINALEKLEFGVEKQLERDNAISYRVTVPSFRASKDVRIKEDIVEEIARFYGYDRIPRVLPTVQQKATDAHNVSRVRLIKQALAYAGSMKEVYTYALYDEQFLESLGWQPDNPIAVQSPVSQNWRHLVTTLMPNLFKAVAQAGGQHDALRFFEWARVWHKKGSKISEQKKLSGIFFQKKGLDFYQAKAGLSFLFDAMRLSVSYHSVDKPDFPWFMPYQTAVIKHNDTIVGYLGMVESSYAQKIAEGDLCAFELDGDFLLSYQMPIVRVNSISKYPDVVRDISMFIPLAVTVDQLKKVIESIDIRIQSVTLVDFFQKEEWVDQRAVTMRYTIVDYHKTLAGDEVDVIHAHIENAVKALGAMVR